MVNQLQKDIIKAVELMAVAFILSVETAGFLGITLYAVS